MEIRLLIAKDNPWLREVLRAFLGSRDIEVTGEAASGPEAVHMALSGEGNVMLLDVDLPEMNGFEVLRKIKRTKPELPILMYSQHEASGVKSRARMLGGSGYLEIRISSEQLIDAIRRVANGKSLWSAADGQRSFVVDRPSVAADASDQ